MVPLAKVARKHAAEIRSDEFEIFGAHGRLIFSGWTETGWKSWRINGWKWTSEKLSLRVTRRMGADAATIELVPRASAKTLVAGVAAARQARCEKLAQVVAQTLAGDSQVAQTLVCDSQVVAQTLVCDASEKPQTEVCATQLKIERAALSPGMRRDQPGRYARIILRRS